MKIEARYERVIMLSIFALLLAFCSLFSSCTGCSESGKRVAIANQPKAEKVAIVTVLEPYAGICTYKVKRIELGVSEWIRIADFPQFSVGDTILYTFKK